MTTYVPTGALCSSACSFIYFAGKSRLVKGALGVHQFSNADNTKRDNVNEVQQNTQYTTSEIIGFLNAFDTPAFVYEEMFASSKMYYFTKEEQIKLSSHESLAILTSVDIFIGSLKQEAELQERQQRIGTIKSLQTELKRLGCYDGLVDGVVGSSTEKALGRYLERLVQTSDWSTDSLVKLTKKLTNESRVKCVKEKAVSAPKVLPPKVSVPKVTPKLNLTNDDRDRLTSGSFYNDQVIETSLIKGIKNASTLLKTAHVSAISTNGIVLLIGQVPNNSTKITVGYAARSVSNVRKVHNELLVSPPASYIVRASDALITSTIKTRMASEKPSIAKHIKVSTENGIVYLMGLVNLKEGDWAVRIAKTASGIQRIVKVFEYIDLDEAPPVANPEAAKAALSFANATESTPGLHKDARALAAFKTYAAEEKAI
jgi:osmotically-inducible protein OsmY